MSLDSTDMLLILELLKLKEVLMKYTKTLIIGPSLERKKLVLIVEWSHYRVEIKSLTRKPICSE